MTQITLISNVTFPNVGLSKLSFFDLSNLSVTLIQAPELAVVITLTLNIIADTIIYYISLVRSLPAQAVAH